VERNRLVGATFSFEHEDESFAPSLPAPPANGSRQGGGTVPICSCPAHDSDKSGAVPPVHASYVTALRAMAMS
jgi:hypothetical protein